MQWPDPRTALGRRTWPQWRGWRHCPATGDLIDPSGQAYGPRTIQAGQLMLQLQDVRDRVIFADTGDRRVLLRSQDMAESGLQGGAHAPNSGHRGLRPHPR